MEISRKRAFLNTSLFIATAVMLIFVIQGFNDNTTIVDSEEGVSNKPYKLPENVTFAGERMPLENFDVRESLEREILTSAYRHSSTILIIKRAGRFLPVISKILAENGIPDDFKYLVAAESEYANVISPAGATGFWQIMKETGIEEGMEINQVIDERYHLEKSTQFACEYLRKSYERFGTWTLAAASYNSGRASINEQIEIQGQSDYYDLLLNEETARYIYRVVAYKLVINDPAAFGFAITEDDIYKPYEYFELKVDTSVSSFADFAAGYATNYKMLKLLNPWLRKPYLTPKPGKVYAIKMPAEGMRNATAPESEEQQ